MNRLVRRTPLKRSPDDHPSLGLIGEKLRYVFLDHLKKSCPTTINLAISFSHMFLALPHFKWDVLLSSKKFFFVSNSQRNNRYRSGGWNFKYMMVVAFQLDAPMLHTSLMVVAHIECNRRPHVEDAPVREYLPKWLLVLRRRRWRGCHRSDRVSTYLSDHTCIFSTCGCCLARSTRTTLYSKFPLTDVFGKLRTAFSRSRYGVRMFSLSLFLPIPSHVSFVLFSD